MKAFAPSPHPAASIPSTPTVENTAMKTFMSLSDLDKLSDDDPAKPVVKQLLIWLIGDGEFPDHPYDPEEHGYIALVEPGDVQRELTDIDMPRLTDVMWEGVSIIDGHYHAVYLGAGDYGIGFVIPVDAPWIGEELRAVLESLLDDPSPLPSQVKTL
jgi:hypothetical protein